MLFFPKGLNFDADDGKSGGAAAPPAGDPQAGGDFAQWLEGQTDEVKSMYEKHTAGLQSALKSEREKSKGVADKLKRLEELEEAEAKREGEKLTEKEKLEKAIAAKDKDVADAKAAAETAQAGARQTLIKAEVRIQARELGFADLSDVEKLADLTGVSVDDDGGVTGVKEALEKLAKAKPYLIKDGTKPPGSPPKTPVGKTSSPKPDNNKPAKPFIKF